MIDEMVTHAFSRVNKQTEDGMAANIVTLRTDAAMHLQQAREMLNRLKDVEPSRPLSVAITELETAILWFEEDQRLQRAKALA